MLARPYQSADAKGLDILLGFNRAGDVRLEQDQIIVVGDVGRPTGVLVFRPGAFVHELALENGALMRLRADALCNYAIARARSKPFELKTAVFSVASSNQKMIAYMESIGAVRQEGQYVYQLSPP